MRLRTTHVDVVGAYLQLTWCEPPNTRARVVVLHRQVVPPARTGEAEPCTSAVSARAGLTTVRPEFEPAAGPHSATRIAARLAVIQAAPIDAPRTALRRLAVGSWIIPG